MVASQGRGCPGFLETIITIFIAPLMPNGQAMCLSFPCPYKFPPHLCKTLCVLMPALSHAAGDMGRSRGFSCGMAGGTLSTPGFLLLSIQWCSQTSPWPHHTRNPSWFWLGFVQGGMSCFILVGQTTITGRIKPGVRSV